jgi:hypothetical protein
MDVKMVVFQFPRTEWANPDSLSSSETGITVKASNFGPHGHFEFSQNGLLSPKRVLEKNEGYYSCRKMLDLQIRFCSFLVHNNSSKEATRPRSPIIGQCPQYWTTHFSLETRQSQKLLKQKL